MSEQALNEPRATKQKTKRKRHIVRKIIVWFIILLVLLGAGYYAYASLKQEYTISYTGYTATIGSISNAASFSGSLALTDSKTYTSASAATVRNVYVAAGDTVKEGDKLVKISTGETVKADFDARINTVSVAAGDEIASGAELVQIADFTHMKVSLRVDEYDIATVAVGQACTVTATATEKEFSSSIAAINYISASSGNVAYYTATAYVDVDAADGVYPGMQVTVTIPQEEAKDVIILKMDALSFDEANSAYVYMYDDTGALAEKSVEVGVSNGNYVEIKSGLSSGDEVYVETETATADSGLSGLLSGLFGGQQTTRPSGSRNGTRDFSNMDFSNFDPSNMPGGGGGGTMPGGTSGGGRQ